MGTIQRLQCNKCAYYVIECTMVFIALTWKIYGLNHNPNLKQYNLSVIQEHRHHHWDFLISIYNIKHSHSPSSQPGPQK